MRKAMIALILPATLAAGGMLTAVAQEAETPPAAEAVEAEATDAVEAVAEGEGAASAEGSKEADAEPAATPTPAPVSANAIAGEWTAAANSVTFTSTDGAPVASFNCIRSDGGNVMALRIPASGQQAETIDVFGGAGAGVIVAEDMGDASVIGGRFDPWGRIGTSLATGLGEVRIVTDNTSVTIANGQLVETLVESCQPPLPTVAERLAAIQAAKAATAASATAESDES